MSSSPPRRGEPPELLGTQFTIQPLQPFRGLPIKSTSVTTHSTAGHPIMMPTFHSNTKRSVSPKTREALRAETKNRKKLLTELPFKIDAASEIVRAGGQNLTFFFSLCHQICPPALVIYLQHNLLQSPDLIDLPLFAPTLRKLDLSHNNLDYLPDVFSQMKQLQFLYLHNNQLAQSWHILEHVIRAPALLHLTLFGNEVRTLPGYRHFLVNKRPSLLALDYHLVTDQERMDHVSISGSERFRAMSDYMRIRVGQEEGQSGLYDSISYETSREHKVVGQTPSPVPRPDQESKFSQSKSPVQLPPKKQLDIDAYRLRRLYQRNSPVILIQALFRSFKSRNKSFSLLNAWKSSALMIQRTYRGWRLRRELRDNLHQMLRETGHGHLIMSYRQDLERRSMARIRRFLRRWIRKFQRAKLELRSAIKIQSYYRGRRTRNTAFLRAIQIHKYPRIYFLRDQGRIIVQLLQKIRPMFPQLGFTGVRDLVLKCQDICTIRYKEPDKIGHSVLPLLQLVRPHLGAVVRENKYLLSEKEAAPEKVQFGKKQLPVEKIANPKWHGIKVASYYPDYAQYKKWLDLFRPRNGHHPMHEIVRAGQKLRMKDDGMPMDRYGDLCIFEPPDVPTEAPPVIAMESLELPSIKAVLKKRREEARNAAERMIGLQPDDQQANSPRITEEPSPRGKESPRSILKKFSRQSSVRQSHDPKLRRTQDVESGEFKVDTPRSRTRGDSQKASTSPRKKLRMKEDSDVVEPNPLKTQLLMTLFFAAFDYNRQHPESPVLLYTHVQLKRAMAATKIQTMYRNWKRRSNIEISVSRCVITRRAILTIQHWWKGLRMRRRLVALADIRAHVSNICSPTLYLQERVYLNLVQLSDMRKRGASFQEQSFVFGIANYQIAIRILCSHNRYDVNSLPRWFDHTTMPVLGSYSAMDAEASAAHQDIMALVHMNENDCELLNFSSIMEHREASLEFIPKLKFVKIEMKNVEEARRRATAIALLTYSFRHQSYVKLFDTEHMANPFFITTLQVLWKQLGYTNPAERVPLNNIEYQPHNGIVILGSDKNLQYLQSSNGGKATPQIQVQKESLQPDEPSLIQVSDNVSLSLFLKTPPDTTRTGGVREVSIAKRDGIKMRMLKTEGAGISDAGNLGSTIPDTDPFSARTKAENVRSGNLRVFDDVLTNDANEHFQQAKSVYLENKGGTATARKDEPLIYESFSIGSSPKVNSENIEEVREAAKRRYLSQTQPSTASSGLEKRSWHMKVVAAKKTNLIQQTVREKERNSEILRQRDKQEEDNKRRTVLQERLVREVMRQEQQKEKEEMETAFRSLNQEEKSLVRSLLNQQARDEHLEILQKKKVVEQKLNVKRVKDNHRMFAKCFAQQHNMIIKQYRVAQARRIKSEQIQDNTMKRRNLEEKLKGGNRIPLKVRNKTPIPDDSDFDSEISSAAHKKSKSMISHQFKMGQTDFSSNLRSGEIDTSQNFLPPIPLSARGIGAVGAPKMPPDPRKIRTRPEIRDIAFRQVVAPTLSETKVPQRVGSGASRGTQDFKYTSAVNSMMDFSGHAGVSSVGDIAPPSKTAYTQILGKKHNLNEISPWKRESFQNIMGGSTGMVPSKFNVSVSYSDKKPAVGKPVRHSDKASVVFGKYVRASGET